MSKQQKPTDSALFLSVQERCRYRCRRTEQNHLTVLICASVMLILSVVVAIFLNVTLGIVVALLTLQLYSYSKKDVLQSTLGLSVGSTPYGLRVTRIRARGDVEYALPRRLLKLDVTELADGALASRENVDLAVLWLPDTLTRIEEHALDGAPSLHTLCFVGTREQWERIEILADVSAYRITFDPAPSDGADTEKGIEPL